MLISTINIYWLTNISAAFLLCVLFAGILIPQILLVAFRRKLFDEPDERKIHKGSVPRLGGIAFTPVICFSIALLQGLNSMLCYPWIEESMILNSTTLAFAFCALFTIYLVGIADDLVGVRYRAKFVVQLFCASLIIAAGIWINNLSGFLLIKSIPWWVGMPLTMLVIVYIVNSINLIDGIDGLASGLSIAACIIYGISFAEYQEWIFAIIAFSTLGVLVPFFYYNVFGNADKHKKIFMGDTGALTIGLLLAFMSMQLYHTSSMGNHHTSHNPLVLSFAPVFIPCLDVVRVFLHRLRRHRNPFLPDQTHIHHKLLAIGLKPRVAMVTIVVFSLALSVISIVLSRYIEVTLLLFLLVGAWSCTNIWLSTVIRRKNNNGGGIK